jgi:hypothetical protein
MPVFSDQTLLFFRFFFPGKETASFALSGTMVTWRGCLSLMPGQRSASPSPLFPKNVNGLTPF